MKRFVGLGAAVAGLLVSAAGSAATVPLSVFVDLNDPTMTTTSTDSFGFMTGLIAKAAKLATPLSIKNGDTLDFKIIFGGTEAITATDVDSFTMRLTAADGTPNYTVSTTGKLSLLTGAAHTVAYTSDQVSPGGAPNAVVGSVDATTKFPTLPNPVTFTGLEWLGVVNFSGAGVTGATTDLFDTASFSMGAGELAITGSVPGVPEPASWAMMVIGFGAVGAGLRGRRAASVKFV